MKSLNLVNAWRHKVCKKHGDLKKSVEYLNMVCMTKLTSGDIGKMEKGRKKVPESVQRFMVSLVILDELDSAGFNSTQGNYEQLYSALSVPMRRDI